MTRPEILREIERCDRCIQHCIAAQSDPKNDQLDRLGALMGELDQEAEKKTLLLMLAELDATRKEAA